MKKRISIIVAMDAKRGIGKDNDLTIRLKEDSKRVRTLTAGHPLVMGRKTFASLGRLLPNRTHIVVTRDKKALAQIHYQPHEIVGSVDEGIAKAAGYPGSEEIFIFGGGQIYKSAIENDLVDRLYLTVVQKVYDADTFFPAYPKFTNILEKEEKEEDGVKYTFLTLEKL